MHFHMQQEECICWYPTYLPVGFFLYNLQFTFFYCVHVFGAWKLTCKQEECTYRYASINKHTCTPADFFILFLLTVVALCWGIVFPSLSVLSAPKTHTCTKKNAFTDMHGHTRMPTHILIYTHLHTPTGLFVTYFAGRLSAVEEAWQMEVCERRSGSGLAEENGDVGKLVWSGPGCKNLLISSGQRACTMAQRRFVSAVAAVALRGKELGALLSVLPHAWCKTKGPGARLKLRYLLALMHFKKANVKVWFLWQDLSQAFCSHE